MVFFVYLIQPGLIAHHPDKSNQNQNFEKMQELIISSILVYSHVLMA